jgi:glycosyltransferase involved in cell wall biosynthesis
MHELVRFYRDFLNKLNIKVIGVYHSDIINKGILGKLYNLYFKKTVNIYDKIMVSSENLWNSSPVLHKLNTNIKVVVPFCIEEFVRVKVETNKSRFRLVSIGRLVPYKGFEFLIDVFNNTEFDLHIIGNGPLLNKLKAKSADNIQIHYNLDHDSKNKLLVSADFLVVGSTNRAEAYGMTIVEAFYCGLPVIAPNINTGVTFLVKDGITGFVYDVLNKEMLLKKVREAISKPNEVQAIKQNIGDFYIKFLSYDCFRKGILKI